MKRALWVIAIVLFFCVVYGIICAWWLVYQLAGPLGSVTAYLGGVVRRRMPGLYTRLSLWSRRRVLRR
jgi:hypothetical protein